MKAVAFAAAFFISKSSLSYIINQLKKTSSAAENVIYAIITKGLPPKVRIT